MLETIPPAYLLAAVPAAVIAYHVLAWLLDPQGIRGVPGPLLAKFTDAWLVWTSAHGHRSEVVHQLHQELGPYVRLAPNHVSIALPAALPLVYAHGAAAPQKSEFYDAFVSIQRGLFNTRDRAAHSRKRKIVSHVFSQKSVLEFEPSVRGYVRELIGQWDALEAQAQKGARGDEGEGGWRGEGGRLWLDCLPWYNYLAFDIIGDLAFGTPFGMIAAAQDSAPVAVAREGGAKDAEGACAVVHIPAIQILNARGEFSATMGCVPPSLRPLVKKLPWFRAGGQAVKDLAGIAVAAVAKRLNQPTDRVDLLSKLKEGKDDEGKPMGREELTAEALTQLIAGSDTTSNSSCAITYYLAANPHTQARLQKELDDALSAEDELASTFDQVKRLPYLEAVINEALRLHSTSAIGLPRLAPAGGLALPDGTHFAAGTVLSVPSYSIHRDAAVWGADFAQFRPERWLDAEPERSAEMQKAFNPFSFGPRACVGRNLASMELLIIISSILRRYEFVLEGENRGGLQTSEGFLRKPLGCKVGIKRRNVL
ncbi:hypothetical protein HWV62_35176 [Athelia sp. TMB]|nr:hypothetical protein HWV62_35176 [Athelia sp. TMB]